MENPVIRYLLAVLLFSSSALAQVAPGDDVVSSGKVWSVYAPVSEPGLKPHVQILNPVNSGIIVRVDKIVVSQKVTGYWTTRIYHPPLADLVQACNLKNGAGPPIAEIRTEAKSGQVYGTPHDGVIVGTNPFTFEGRGYPYLELSEGRGALAVFHVIGGEIAVSIHWREIGAESAAARAMRAKQISCSAK